MASFIERLNWLKPRLELALEGGSPGGLLYSMGEFMSEKLTAHLGGGIVLTIGEDDVTPNRIGQCVDRAGGSVGGRAGMDADRAEVVAEAGFEVTACGGSEGSARLPQGCVNSGGRNSGLGGKEAWLARHFLPVFL